MTDDKHRAYALDVARAYIKEFAPYGDDGVMMLVGVPVDETWPADILAGLVHALRSQLSEAEERLHARQLAAFDTLTEPLNFTHTPEDHHGASRP